MNKSALYEDFNKPILTYYGPFVEKNKIKKPDINEFSSTSDFNEATIGFEPMNQGVADPRLTTWLCRHRS